MALNISFCWKRLLLLSFFLIFVNGQTSRPSFMVTFPAVIESGSEAKLCASLLKPNESLVMNIHLVHGNQSTLLLQEKAEEEFHRCFNFKAPPVKAESVQKMKVELQGETFKMTEERKVMFKPYHLLTFIQTDKPIYIPGQTVNFRVVTMDTKFAPLDQQDSRGNRIGQWTNVSSTRWILQRSYELNPEARQGMYKLKAFISDRMISHHFEVKKYVLPKFEVTVKSPNKVSVEEEELIIEVCGKYTYGQPVPGTSWVKVCRNNLSYHTHHTNPVCLEETIEIKKTGCAIHTLDASVFFNATLKYRLQDSLRVEAMVTEEGTEITMTKSKSVSLTFKIGKVKFTDLPKTYKHGSVIEGKIKLSNFKGAPIQNKEVYLMEGHVWSPKLLLNLTTDSDGLASFSLNTSSCSKSDINLIASAYPEVRYSGHKRPYISADIKLVQLFQPDAPYNPTLSELIIENTEQPLKCDSECTVTIKYYFVGETIEDFKTDIVYMVLSRGVIFHHGYEKFEVKSSNGVASGTMSFKLSISADLAPVVQILVYCVLPSENVVASSKNVDIEKCFKNKVSLQFSPAKAVPGEKNTLQLSAQPGSLCGLNVVDQSVLILKSGERLDTDKIFNLLPVQVLSYYPYTVEDEQKCLHVRPRRAVLTDNAYESLKRVGLKMATNLDVRVPLCLSYKGLMYLQYETEMDHAPSRVMYSLRGGDFGNTDRDSPAVTIRTIFPETWIWDLAEVGDSGSAQVPVTVPDTITSWETEAFCLSSEGLGLAPPAQLTVFQPFFLELSLPYSIIRGEIFELKATVFNYLSKCIMVKVTPAPSSDYTLKASSDDQYSSCLCANGRKTFKWILTPSVLGVLNITVSAEAEASQTVCDNEIVSVPERGRIDTVTRSLLVQAEGTEKEETHSWLLCPNGDSLSEEVSLTLPKDVIEGSARSSVSVIGDILGRALRNLHRLLRMPYGCGEQNMAVLSPNIYILQYLEKTEQLTSAIRERATGFLKSGYQRQLNYRHNSGAYSTFGRGNGNTWLTAFVLRSFGKAQRYIFVDSQIIQSAKNWLISKRDSDGCFLQQGSLFNNRMKGGVNDNVTMTAYITASLLELETPVTDPVVSKGLSCLRSVIEDVKNIYTTALLTYTFSLARDTYTRQQLFKKLEDVAISDGSLLHWSQSASADDSDSLAVEISSYVLLAVLTADTITTADLGYANRIVSWLVKQQNAFGGFSSTQDTVVALQALALYATKVFSSDGSSTVTVQSAGDTHHFDVNQDNKLLYQEKQLQSVPAKYSIEVKGSTCVSVQMAQFYNIPTPTQAKTLSIDAKFEGDCKKTSGQYLLLNFTVKYDGPQLRTNMVIVDIKLLSGFTADTSMVPKNIPVNHQLQLKQILPVKNLKPAVIKVYDYYQTKPAGFAPSQPPVQARGNLFNELPSPQQLHDQEKYKDCLKQQIEEKRRKEAEERERSRLEDEKEERRLDEQRARIQREFEEEQKRKRQKEKEHIAKNEELIRQAELRRKEAEKLKKEAEEKENEALRKRHEREKQTHLEEVHRAPSPPLPTLQKKLRQQMPRPPSVESHRSSATVSMRSMSAPQSPPVPARRNEIRATEEKQTVIRELSALRRQLRSEQRRLEGQLMQSNGNDHTPPIHGRPREHLPEDVFEVARLHKQVPIRRPASHTTAAANMHNLQEFNHLKYRDGESRKEVRQAYPDPPSDDHSLDIQQQALLRQQQRTINSLRRGRPADYFDMVSSGKQHLEQRLNSAENPGRRLLLDSESAFIDPSGDSFHLHSWRDQRARPAVRKTDISNDVLNRYTRPDSGPDSQSLHSLTSTEIERLRERTKNKMSSLNNMREHDWRSGEVSAEEGEELWPQTPSTNRRVSIDTIATDPWLRPSSSDTLKRFMGSRRPSNRNHAGQDWEGPSTYHG
ncbi:Alpha-2-macroglobulin [Anabarilius grahami]|uniref:Alpha-2-macroglobulin n=1 Tax=Anabarilius grahami TaxID=495550 RepID=A0A3N0XXN4_ANAGA|nr:Alpha-2-macroglobulin [Anabarilius grahami]